MSLIQQINEKKQRAAQLVEEGRTQNAAAKAAGRDLSPEETESWQKRFDDVDKLKAEIALLERQERLEREFDREHSKPVAMPDSRGGAPKADEWRDAYAKEFGSRFKAPPAESAEVDDQRRLRRCSLAYQKAFAQVLAGDVRALQADVDTAGGFTFADEQFNNRLIKFTDDMVFIRRRATTFTVTNADSLGFPSLDADPADSDWTVELGTGSEDSTMAFGKRQLTPHPLGKRIKVSDTLSRRSSIGIDGLVISRLGYKFAVTEEKGFLTGTGAQQPLGVFTASANGISTGRDTTTAVGAVIDGDDLKNVKYALKGAYWGNASWLMHRDRVRDVAKLKDGDGRYMWQDSITMGEPDRLLTHPVDMSEFSPSATTTGVYAAILGDFSNYWIADALTLRIQRLVELYAETNQVGFIGRLECDGMPVLEEAFQRLKFL